MLRLRSKPQPLLYIIEMSSPLSYTNRGLLAYLLLLLLPKLIVNGGQVRLQMNIHFISLEQTLGRAFFSGRVFTFYYRQKHICYVWKFVSLSKKLTKQLWSQKLTTTAKGHASCLYIVDTFFSKFTTLITMSWGGSSKTGNGFKGAETNFDD